MQERTSPSQIIFPPNSCKQYVYVVDYIFTPYCSIIAKLSTISQCVILLYVRIWNRTRHYCVASTISRIFYCAEIDMNSYFLNFFLSVNFFPRHVKVDILHHKIYIINVGIQCRYSTIICLRLCLYHLAT